MENEKTTYSLSTVDNPNINSIRELTVDDFNRYSSYISELSRLSSDENLFRIVELNYIDLKTNLDTYIINFSKRTKEDFFEFDQLFLNVNRLILNFLSTARTFLDHTETRLKRKYGANSEELKKFETSTSEAYDNNFAYRFLYKLRNFSQHCGLPTGSITINSSADKKGETINNLTLFLVRNDLLSEFDSWGQLVKEELKNQPETFDIIPLVDEKFKLLKEINQKLNKRIYSKLKQEAQVLMDLIWETQKLGGIPCLIKAKGTSDKLNLSMVWFPYKPISRITGVNIEMKHKGENPTTFS